jgi:hypothetical protein
MQDGRKEGACIRSYHPLRGTCYRCSQLRWSSEEAARQHPQQGVVASPAAHRVVKATGEQYDGDRDAYRARYAAVPHAFMALSSLMPHLDVVGRDCACLFSSVAKLSPSLGWGTRTFVGRAVNAMPAICVACDVWDSRSRGKGDNVKTFFYVHTFTRLFTARRRRILAQKCARPPVAAAPTLKRPGSLMRAS